MRAEGSQAEGDDAEYHRSARNMFFVLALMGVVVAAALAASVVLQSTGGPSPTSTSADSPYGFSLDLAINATAIPQGGSVNVTASIVSSSSHYETLGTNDSWEVAEASLFAPACPGGFPMGIGVVRGHVTVYNYTSGDFLQYQPAPGGACQAGSASSFLLAPHGSRAIVTLQSGPEDVVLRLSTPFGRGGPFPLPAAGPYTIVAADEWGDVATLELNVS